MNDVTVRFIEVYNYLLSIQVIAGPKDFAEKISVSTSMITEIIKGRSNVGVKAIQNTVNVFSVSPFYLFSGEGKMLLEKSISKSISSNISLSAKNADLAEKESGLSSDENGHTNGHLEQRNIYPDSNLTRPSVDIVSIPIVEISVAAGDGYYNGDTLDVIDSIQLPQSMVKRGSQYFCVRVKGESMAPTLLDSSFLVIRLLDRSEWEYMPEEQVYVVTDRDGKAYVKRVKNRLDKGFIVCMSDNPDKVYYPNFNLQADEIHTIWHAEWYISAKMPNIHQTYYTKVSQLEDDMAEMKNDITMLKRLLKH